MTTYQWWLLHILITTAVQVLVIHTPKDQEPVLIPLVWVEQHQIETVNLP